MPESYTYVEPEPSAQTSDAFIERWDAVNDIQKLQQLQVRLPELRSEVRDVYERVVEAERALVAANLLTKEYGEGTAVYDDQVYQAWAHSAGGVLIGADHATDPVRKATGIREGADHGTAGLAAVVAEDMPTDLILPLGRQTGNSATTPDYAYKNELLRTMQARRSAGLLSMHGMRPGLVLDPCETVEAHALVGLGKYQVRPQTLEAVEYLQDKAQSDLGLRVLISNDNHHLLYEATPHRPGTGITDKVNRIKVDEQGQPVRSRLAAMGEQSVANFVMRSTGQLQGTLPVFQFEISRSLRLTPKDMYNRDQRALEHGVYMGYLLSRLAVESIQTVGTKL